ncbi:MAG TPA: hypothetical protein VHP36_10475 [Chitinispirillaceae bacterium]|nr:hypothetical protein [Chitinispirillaceae bacterium]
MTDDFNEYINKRISDLLQFRLETYNILTAITKTKSELNINDEKEILENKMKYYMASGALSELEEIKQIFLCKIDKS